MITHVWSVLCSQSITNEQTKNISLIEVLEQLTVTGTPLPEGQTVALSIIFDVVSLWIREPRDQPTHGFARIRLLSPTGDDIRATDEYALSLSTRHRTRGVARIRGLPIQGEGIYHFVVQMREEGETDWRDVARLPLEIRIQPAEEAAAV